MKETKKQSLSSEIERLEKRQIFHQQQAQKSAARLKELLNQNRNNHLMAFGVGVELKYLVASEECRQKMKDEYCNLYADDQRMRQRAMDGFARLDKQLAGRNDE